MAINFQFTFNGYTFGGIGSDVQILEANGIQDLPDLRTTDATRGYQDGMLYGRDFLNGRTVELKLLVVGGTNPFSTNIANLLAATAITGQNATLSWQFPGEVAKQITCRVRRRQLPIDVNYQYNYAEVVIQFFAADPRIYSQTTKAIGANLPTASGGAIFNATFPLTFGVAGSGNTAVCANNGNTTTYPVFTITGPVTNPRVTCGTSSLEVDVTLTSTDTLTIDTMNRTILLNNSASRRNALNASSAWFALPPGSNLVSYTASAYTTSTLTVSYSDAYL